MSPYRTLARRLKGERRRVALRSTLVQAVWNYDSLQAIGFGWAILPGLERIRPDVGERAKRLEAHLETFNANPYLASVAMGVAFVLPFFAELRRGSPVPLATVVTCTLMFGLGTIDQRLPSKC